MSMKRFYYYYYLASFLDECSSPWVGAGSDYQLVGYSNPASAHGPGENADSLSPVGVPKADIAVQRSPVAVTGASATSIRFAPTVVPEEWVIALDRTQSASNEPGH